MSDETQQVPVDDRWDVDFPIHVLDRALPHLRRPFESAAVRWKVQAAREGFGTVIAYIDGRLVIERLNLVVGAGWSDEYAARGQGVEECALTVFGVTRRDVGKGGGIETEKAARSDSLKRAAVKFGIGVSIYALKSVELKATKEWQPDGERLLIANSSRPGKGQNSRPVWSARMSPLAERWLAAKYDEWLEARGVELFGPALGHGDEEGAQGLEGAPVAAVEPEATPEPQGGGQGAQIEGVEADVLRRRADELHGEIKAMSAAAIPPAKHKADLRRAGSTSLDALGEYVAKLDGIKTTMEEARA